MNYGYCMDEKEDKKMMSIKTVCDLYDVKKSKVYQWFEKGLPKHKCAGTKIRTSELEQFIAEGKA